MNNEKIEKGDQAEHHPEVPITSYKQFENLLQLKFTLLRALHTSSGSGKRFIRESLEEVNRSLAACQYYKEFMKRYAETVKEIG